MIKKLFQWIKTNKILLINAGSLIGSAAVTSGLGFLYWWFAARQNSPKVIGLASAAISSMILLGTFSMLGLGTLLIGELPRQRGNAAPLISAALMLVSVVGGGVGIFYALLASYLFPDFQVFGANLGNTILFALGVSLTALTLVLDQALIGLLRGEMQLWRNALFAVIKLAALLAADIWLTDVTGLTIYATLVIGNLCSLGALAVFVVVKHTGPIKVYQPQWRLLRQLGPEALKHHTLNLLIQVPSLLLPVLVTIMLSAEVNAWFYVAWNLSSIANTVSVALASTLYAVSAARPEVLASKLRLTLSLACVGCVLISSVLIVAPQQTLELFGHSYSQQAAWSLRVLALESLPFIIKNHFIALSRIRKQIGRTILIISATGCLELGSSIVGMYLGGLNGLSLGWFSAMCVEAVCMLSTVYAAARSLNGPGQISSEQISLATPAVWLQKTITLPAEGSSLGEQAAWLLDTLALTTIKPDVTEAHTLTHLMAVTRQRKKINTPGQEKQRLRPTRLERFSPDTPAALEVYHLENEDAEKSDNSTVMMESE